MPAGRLQTWRLERDRWLTCNPPPHTPEQEREFRSLWTVRIENWLDAGHGSCLLRCPETQAIVEGVMRYGDGSMYGLGDYVIMPNHVHVLVRLSDGIELSDVTGIWKATSARRINRLLSRTGRLWQDESFDHVVRDEAALWRFVKYIRDNPRKLPPGSTRLGRGSLAIAE